MPLELHLVQKGKELELEEAIDVRTGKKLEKLGDYRISQKQAEELGRLLLPSIIEFYQDPNNVQVYVEWLEEEAAKGDKSAIAELPEAKRKLAEMKKA